MERAYQHPRLIRITHWINVVALTVMITSGLRIYNASPLFAFSIPSWLTLGGWLAGARQWHFFGMWLFFGNGILWLLYNLLSRHGRRTTLFRLKDAGGVLPMIGYYLRIVKVHPPDAKYNPLQKLAYTAVAVIALGTVASGIAIYWPVQFQWMTSVFGNYETARVWHFGCMALLVLFSAGHLFMVAFSGWSNFVSMITGWKRLAPPAQSEN